MRVGWNGAARMPVERASPIDLMELASDVGPVPMNVGALLILDAGPGFSLPAAQQLLAERSRAIPRLRQRLRRAPPGCGRPYWADDPAFDIGWHVRELPCPRPGDERALLDLTASVAGEPLPRSRPLWAARFITGLADRTVGLVIVMHHVLADGIGGLAVLAQLADGAALPAPGEPGPGRSPAPQPTVRMLAADAWAGRLHRLAQPRRAATTLRQGLAELGGTRPPRAPRTSLNRPVTARRRLDVVDTGLAGVRELAHAHGGTVNDAVLAAVTGAVRQLLASREETADRLVVSIPVAGRTAASAAQLGNVVGVMPLALPTAGDLPARLTRIAAITRQRKTGARGASAALVGPAFRLLAAVRLLRWFISHQQFVHTFVTNLRGPEQPMSFAGAPARAVIPLPNLPGNVTVTFGVLSYAGTLRITVLSDPARMPDAGVLVAALRAELSG